MIYKSRDAGRSAGGAPLKKRWYKPSGRNGEPQAGVYRTSGVPTSNVSDLVFVARERTRWHRVLSRKRCVCNWRDRFRQCVNIMLAAARAARFTRSSTVKGFRACTPRICRSATASADRERGTTDRKREPTRYALPNRQQPRVPGWTEEDARVWSAAQVVRRVHTDQQMLCFVPGRSSRMYPQRCTVQHLHMRRQDHRKE